MMSKTSDSGWVSSGHHVIAWLQNVAVAAAVTVSKNMNKYLQVWRRSYLELYGHFRCLVRRLSEIRLHLLGTVFLSGFQGSIGALKSTE